ncbi:MAG TPA: hypothetical protein VJR91_28150 [Burkholderia sp.]|nr:hypothetical protein [Burkholderia sp.]
MHLPAGFSGIFLGAGIAVRRNGIGKKAAISRMPADSGHRNTDAVRQYCRESGLNGAAIRAENGEDAWVGRLESDTAAVAAVWVQSQRATRDPRSAIRFRRPAGRAIPHDIARNRPTVDQKR